MNQGYVYITTSGFRGTMYIGVTSNLIKRIGEHKNSIDAKSFTTKYNCKKLVYYETFSEISDAIQREKQLKNWHRDWKIHLIESQNPYWNDIYKDIIQ